MRSIPAALFRGVKAGKSSGCFEKAERENPASALARGIFDLRAYAAWLVSLAGLSSCNGNSGMRCEIPTGD